MDHKKVREKFIIYSAYDAVGTQRLYAWLRCAMSFVARRRARARHRRALVIAARYMYRARARDTYSAPR